MKIVAISDLHGFLPTNIPKCDLLLIAGDICPVVDHSFTRQYKWLHIQFRDWLERVPAKEIVGVAGNHDLIFDPNDCNAGSWLGGTTRVGPPKDLPWHYLEDSSIDLLGKRIFGFPWQLWYGGWAFNCDEDGIDTSMQCMPRDTDIVVAHGPPYGFGDIPIHDRPKGSSKFRKKIVEVKPQLTVFGHIHEGRGCWNLPGTDCILANVALVNRAYQMIHDPMEFNID